MQAVLWPKWDRRGGQVTQRSTARAAVVLAAAGLAMLALAGCGGAAKNQFTAIVLAEDETPKEVLDRALEQAIMLCSVAKPPTEVTWVFSKADADRPIIADYQHLKFPQRQPCAAIAQSKKDGILGDAPPTTAAVTKK